MEREEFKTLVKGMKAVYAQPSFIPDQDAFNVWYALMQDLEYKVCNVAIQKWMLTNKFPPTIADIRELAASIHEGEQLTWGESWRMFKAAVRKYGYDREREALESLDPLTRKCTEIFGYREFCISDIRNEMADRAHFQRIFETLAQREKTDRQIALPVKEAIAQLSGSFSMESKGNGQRLLKGVTEL